MHENISKGHENTSLTHHIQYTHIWKEYDLKHVTTRFVKGFLYAYIHVHVLFTYFNSQTFMQMYINVLDRLPRFVVYTSMFCSKQRGGGHLDCLIIAGESACVIHLT